MTTEMTEGLRAPARPVCYGTDEKDLIAWACSDCTALYMLNSWHEEAKERAEHCCHPVCTRCRAATTKGHILCSTCRASTEAEAESAKFGKAKKIPLAEYDGKFLYLDGWPNEGYVQTEILEEVLDLEGQERPLYAWACEPDHASFNVQDALDSYLQDNHHEDAGDWVNGKLVTAAQIVVDEALTKVVSYNARHDLAVLLVDTAPVGAPAPAVAP